MHSSNLSDFSTVKVLRYTVVDESIISSLWHFGLLSPLICGKLGQRIPCDSIFQSPSRLGIALKALSLMQISRCLFFSIMLLFLLLLEGHMTHIGQCIAGWERSRAHNIRIWRCIYYELLNRCVCVCVCVCVCGCVYVCMCVCMCVCVCACMCVCACLQF